jgi:LysR family cyn operon transcriptional activator
MELRHLRYFIRAAELLHFTRAAESLHVSQPTLSIHIQQLEEELDSPLFDRSRQLRLTEAGELFFVQARNAIRELERGKEGVADLRGLLRGTLRVGSTHVFTKKLVPAVITEYNKMYPGIHLVVQLGTSRDIEQGILKRDIDVGLAFLPPESDEIESEALASDEVFLVVSENHPLAQRTEITKSELSELPLAIHSVGHSTRRLIDIYFAKEKISPKVLVEINDVPAILAIVASSTAGAIASRRAVDGLDLHMIPLPGVRLFWTAGVLRLKAAPLSAAAKAFVKLVKAHL